MTPREASHQTLIQPAPLFELPGQVGFGQVAEVLVGERVELVLEAGREHALDLVLLVLLLKAAVLEQLLGLADVLVVQLDADVAREAVAVELSPACALPSSLFPRRSSSLGHHVYPTSTPPRDA